MNSADDDESFVIDCARRAGLGGGLAAVGIGDDAAVIGELVVTTDTMVEGRHWDARLSAGDVGFKLVAVNASDVAAMGGRPQWCTVALSLPWPLDRAWVSEFYAGLREGLAEFGGALVGGDTTGIAGPRVASLTMGGSAPKPVLRSGGQPGHDLWVTGELGRAGEAMLRPAPAAEALAWLRRPRPPVAFGAALGEAGLASAMMDLSDGLVVDLPRLCAASGVGAQIDPASLPGERPLDETAGYGEDYELLFAAPVWHRDAICSLAAMHRVRVSRVGLLTVEAAVRLTAGTWPPRVFDHFQEPSR